MALVDTGATNSAIDDKVRVSLGLRSQCAKDVLFPNATQSEERAAYTCLLRFFRHPSDAAPSFDWPDLIEALAFDFSGRPYQAVIGMDVLAKGTLTIKGKGPIAFAY